MRLDAKLAVLIAIAVCSGCMSDEHRRADGLTDNAGEAIAANTVMQMVDPWQDGVQDTRLRVPAVRGPAAAGSGDASQSQTMDSGS
ncbi:MAG TPA: hypothetical protein VIZ90_20180 [Rhizobiaceae bacterium]